MNLNLVPKDTFVYDEVEGRDLEKWLDHVYFYNELDLGFTAEKFNQKRELKIFVPTATYD